jgi:hypothetical protein
MPKALTTVWNALTGYKTIVGLVITLLAFLSQWVPDVMSAAQVDPTLVAKVVGGFVSVLGLLHKAYRLLYGEEVK